MASKSCIKDCGANEDALIAQLKKWNIGTKDESKMNNKAWGKMVKDCYAKESTTIKNSFDSSVFPAVADRTTKMVDLTNKDQVNLLMGKAAANYKSMKKISKPENEVLKEMCDKICSTEPDVKQVATSKTGGVAKMTDASQYTGAHKERFDKDGKGKGAEGRSDKADNTGYVGQYKGSGTYGKK